MNLKKLLKKLKYNESTVSMILGVIVILIVGLFIIKNYNKEETGETLPSIGTEELINTEAGKYIVQKGDSLWVIAENKLNSGYDWIKIADANNIKPPYGIEVGQKLIIPVSSVSVTPTISEISPTKEIVVTKKAEITSTVQPSTTIKSDKYVVISGDNLWNIAVRAYGDGYKWIEIAKANNLKNPSLIHSGNEFVIPR